MVDFDTPTATYKYTRKYAEITDVDDFTGLAAVFVADTTMGLTEKKVSAESFKGVKNILDTEGNVVATITVESKSVANYSDAFDAISNSWAETNYDAGYTAVEDTDKQNWKMTLSGVTAAGDSFKLQVAKTKAVLDGFHLTATKNTLETWADAQDELSGEPSA